MLPWGGMQRAALAAGVPMAAFWELSLREWRWLASGGQAFGIRPAELADLMEQFPDKGT